MQVVDKISCTCNNRIIMNDETCARYKTAIAIIKITLRSWIHLSRDQLQYLNASSGERSNFLSDYQRS